MIRYAAGNPNRTTLCYAVKENKPCRTMHRMLLPNDARIGEMLDVVTTHVFVFVTSHLQSPPSPHLVPHLPHPLLPPRPPPCRDRPQNYH